MRFEFRPILTFAATTVVLIWQAPCLAGTTYQRALAAVAVAQAALEVADDAPRLPDSAKANPPDRLPESEQADRQTSPAHFKKSTNIEPHEAVNKGTEAHKIPAIPIAMTPMRLELMQASILTEALPAQLVISGWERGCPVCLLLESDIKRTLTPLGWSIGRAATDQIRFVHIPNTEAVPQISLYQNGTQIRAWDKYTDPGVLSQCLRLAWDQAPEIPRMPNVAGAAEPIGTIHAKSQIQYVFAWWRSRLGEGVRTSFNWDRTGAQQFPLLAKGDWTAQALFGKSGRVELSAPGATGLPVNSLGFGYRVAGDDMQFDLDPVTIKGLALRLGPARPAESPTPSQIDPMTAWTVFTILRDLWSLLHPTCDLQLGGNVSATAVLQSDKLTVEFQQCPSVKLVALFTFQLRIDRVEITENSVRVLFGGSRLIKERTFLIR